MELRIKRTDFSDQSTIGELSVNGQFECYTLEDKVRPEKIAGKTAIPAGRYEVVISFSQRFQRPLPLLLKVPNFEGIRIHPGNTAGEHGRMHPGGRNEERGFYRTEQGGVRKVVRKAEGGGRDGKNLNGNSMKPEMVLASAY